MIIPEKLDSFINKFAEYTHEKWAFDKVGIGVLPSAGIPTPASSPQDLSLLSVSYPPQGPHISLRPLTSWDPQLLLESLAPPGFPLCVPRLLGTFHPALTPGV